MIDQGEVMVLLFTLKVRLHIVTKTVFAVISKVFLLAFFFFLNLIQSLHRAPNKSDFIKHINNLFTETWVSDKEECYILGDLNINLILDEKETFSNKSYRTNSQNLPHLTKDYLNFFFSLEQLISIPITVTSKTVALTDHVLSSSSQKVSQCGVIELGISISDNDLAYSTRKTTSLKPNKLNEISIRSMKNYTKEKYLEQLWKTDLPDYLNKTYQDFLFKLNKENDLLCPIKIKIED